MILKRCSFTGCSEHVPSSVMFCARHRRQRNQTYGRRHRDDRRQVMQAHGWRCFYCGEPVDLSDDVAHLALTSSMTPAQAQRAARVPAHRKCHNAHAPHLVPSA